MGEGKIQNIILVYVVLFKNPLIPQSVNLLRVTCEIHDNEVYQSIFSDEFVGYLVRGWQVSDLVIWYIFNKFGHYPDRLNRRLFLY
jgi:hypothetical protein